MGRGPFNLILYILAIILVIVGIFQLLGGALLFGIILIVVGLVLASHERTFYR